VINNGTDCKEDNTGVMYITFAKQIGNLLPSNIHYDRASYIIILPRGTSGMF
jgi:hypothetical protein